MDFENFRYKLLHIFLPAALLSISLLSIYSAINWFFIAKTSFLDEDVVDYWLPLLIAGGLEFILVAPRIRLLDLGKKNGSFYVNMAVLALLAAPVLLAQTYIRSASGEIIHVKNAEMIPAAPAYKYYSAGQTCLDHEGVGVKTIIQVSGRHDEWLDFNVYAVMPLCAPSTSGNGSFKSPVWIALKFQKSVENSLSEADKEKAFGAFIEQTKQSLATEDPTKYRYLERAGANADRRDYEKALARRGIASSASIILLIPRMTPFDQRVGDWLPWTFYSLGIGTLIWLGIVLAMPLDETRLESESRDSGRKKSGAEMFLVPSAASYGLPLLIDLNIGVFLAMVLAGLGVISFNTDDLIAWGANYGPALHGSGYLRLITSQFVHGGIMHLANNMYGLLVAGVFLGSALQNWRLILCYLIAGLGGSVAGAILHPNIASVGASGSILGLWGVLVVMAALGDARLAELKKPVLVNGAVFVTVTLVLGSMTPGIDNSAHVGGFLTGALLGVAIVLFNRHQLSQSTTL